ncbi:hydrolase [Sphaerisporangium melleum]|uniref:Hydrolase n=1 Tax=Sphaerisporangium melleum TaxID=321316 RepID=A0A917VIP4_9ACTN|nr:VOC family protein [Sphaerisporangium melleum]GGK82692.1 hydrolase [Sphaerisporangium melleum]GII69195.1 hydrolase [Sphaerisporangium melleum]
MSNRYRYPDGAPCWPELTTHDVPGAVRFYQKVFGWQCRDLGPRYWNYTMCLVDDQPVAAITPPAVGLESVEPAWNTYLTTSDVEASAVRVEAYDGKLIILPTTLPEEGRFALAADPEETIFGLWEPGTHVGSSLYGDVGAMCWNEVNARNARVTDTFYHSLFGYQQLQVGDGVDYDYVVWKVGDVPVCGRLRVPYEAEWIPRHWVLYLRVFDCAEAIDRIVRGGGSVRIPMYESHNGPVAVVADPFGAEFALCQHAKGAHPVGVSPFGGH